MKNSKLQVQLLLTNLLKQKIDYCKLQLLIGVGIFLLLLAIIAFAEPIEQSTDARIVSEALIGLMISGVYIFAYRSHAKTHRDVMLLIDNVDEKSEENGVAEKIMKMINNY